MGGKERRKGLFASPGVSGSLPFLFIYYIIAYDAWTDRRHDDKEDRR